MEEGPLSMNRRFRNILGLWLFFFLFWVSFSQSMSTVSAAPNWRIEINIPALTMMVYSNDMEWGRFPVAVGKMATPTPEGNFTIISKVMNPTWFPPKKPPVPPGPGNPLGKYWFGLSRKGYGIHGNNRPSSIGHPVSNGCIRMRNEDVQRLFGVLPVGTPVHIVYRWIETEKTADDKVYLQVHPDVYKRSTEPWNDILAFLMMELPSYPYHTEGLRWVLGEKRPQRVEIPRGVPLVVDGEVYPQEGFFWNDQLYIPRVIQGMWGAKVESVPAYIPYEELDVALPGGCIFERGPDGIRIKTIRVVVDGQQLSLRALYSDEPLLELEELISALSSEMLMTGVEPLLLAESQRYGGRHWIRMSQIHQLAQGIYAEWDPMKGCVRIGYPLHNKSYSPAGNNSFKKTNSCSPLF